MLNLLIKMGLLLVSYVGLWEFCREKLKVSIYFAPLYTLALQFLVLFAAGLLNYLPEATFLMHCGGIIIFLFYLRSKGWKLFVEYLNWGYFAFAAIFIVLVVYLNDRMFTHIDNFTHWALVVKNMLYSDRFPTVLDKAITFKSYPLGSASIIYYFSKLIRSEEWIMMLAQAYMMLCAILPVFSYVKKYHVLSTTLVMATTGLLLCYNIPMDALLVDTLLPLIGASALLFVHHECLARSKETPKVIYELLPLLFWIINIKDAGIFFVIAVLAYLIMENGLQKDALKPYAITGIFLLAGNSLWKHHCDYVFGNAANSMHTVSFSKYAETFLEKSQEYNWQVIKSVLHYAFSRTDFIILATLLAVIGIFAWILRKEDRDKIVKLGGAIAGIYIIYVLCVLGIYLFSMPEYEGLSSLARYLKVIDIFLYLIFIVFIVSMLSIQRKKALCIVGAMIAIVLTMCNWRFHAQERTEVLSSCCTTEERLRIEEPMWEYGVVPEKTYLILGDSRPGVEVFQRYLWRYHMRTTAVDVIAVTDVAQLAEEKAYDYVVVLDEENPIIKSWLQEKYPENGDRTVIQHFH